MKKYSIYINRQNQICLEGIVEFDNVVEIRNNGIELMNTVKQVNINLVELKQTDSSGLALLIAWIRDAKEQQKELKLYNFPRFLADLSRVSGLDAILPVAT